MELTRYGSEGVGRSSLPMVRARLSEGLGVRISGSCMGWVGGGAWKRSDLKNLASSCCE